jgi:hypothetical protein
MTIEEKIEKYRPAKWVAELMKATNRSEITIYKVARKYGRIPTVEEVLNRKSGRPKKYL